MILDKWEGDIGLLLLVLEKVPSYLIIKTWVEDHGQSANTVERDQTGVRIEKRILQVLKALAAKHDIGLGDLIEGIVLHSFDSKSPFDSEALEFIGQMKIAFGLELNSDHNHHLSED